MEKVHKFNALIPNNLNDVSIVYSQKIQVLAIPSRAIKTILAMSDVLQMILNAI